jgi:hypothetical protein
MIIAILSVWEFVGTNIAGRTISTLLIVIVACGAFAFSNKLFGPKVE